MWPVLDVTRTGRFVQ